MTVRSGTVLRSILLVTFALGWLGSTLQTTRGSAHAFESNEHLTVSNEAFRLVFSYLMRRGAGDAECRVCWVLAEFMPAAHDMAEVRTPAEPGGLTYGHFVLLADYLRDPGVQYRVWDTFGSLPGQMSDIDLEYLRELKTDPYALAQTSYLNNEHFQDQLLRTQWWWHRAALYVALAEDNLFGALLLNAYADHFLEDFFAPGHVVTPRRRLHDVAALGIHDNYNDVGARFRVDNWDDLDPLVDAFDTQHLRHLREAAATLRKQMRTGRNVRVLYGDNHLGATSIQRALMVLVVARSILDVVETHETKRMTNHFTKFTWKSRRVVTREEASEVVNVSPAAGGPVVLLPRAKIF